MANPRRKLNEAEVTAETPSTAQESTYSVEQLISEYKAFKCNRDLVVVALRLHGNADLNFSEAERIIEEFKNKEVR